MNAHLKLSEAGEFRKKNSHHPHRLQLERKPSERRTGGDGHEGGKAESWSECAVLCCIADEIDIYALFSCGLPRPPE